MPKKIYYFYGAFNENWRKLKHIQFIKGLPDPDFQFKRGSLVIIDDLMAECSNNPFITDLFTKMSHHMNLSIVLVSHNLFCPGKEFRTISLNCHYFILFKNVRDTFQISLLGRQMYGAGSKDFLSQVYKSATNRLHGYLCIDFRAITPDKERLRTNVLKSDGPIIYYAEKKPKRPHQDTLSLACKSKENKRQKTSIKKSK